MTRRCAIEIAFDDIYVIYGILWHIIHYNKKRYHCLTCDCTICWLSHDASAESVDQSQDCSQLPTHIFSLQCSAKDQWLIDDGIV